MSASQKASPQMQVAGPPHIIVEAAELAEKVAHVVKPVAGVIAFRKYNWLFGAPVLNIAGNLRGMVVNKSMRVIYGVSSAVGEKLALTSILVELGKESSKMRKVAGSDMPLAQKGPLLIMMADMAALRGITGPVPAAAHLLAQLIEGSCNLAHTVTGSEARPRWIGSVEAADVAISSFHSRVFDGQNYYNFINQHVGVP